MMRTKSRILLAGPDLRRLAEISGSLDPRDYAEVIAHTEQPARYLSAPSSGCRPDAAVIQLSGREDVAVLHEMLASCSDTCFVLLIDEMPPTAAFARVAAGQAVFMDRHEAALSISATLVALMYQFRYASQRL